MPFISENRLEEALVAAVKDPTTAPHFYRQLLDANLLVLGTVNGQTAATERFVAEPGSSFSFTVGEKNGQKFLPVFSSLPRMQAYLTQESPYLMMKGRDLLETTRGAPVVLNPGSDYGREFSAREIELLLGGAVMQGHVFRLIGDIAPPPALVEAMTALFKTRTDVANAWIIHIAFAEDDYTPRPLLGVETTGNMASLVAAIQQAAPGLEFDVERVDRANPSGIANALLQAPPFYTHRPAAPGRILN